MAVPLVHPAARDYTQIGTVQQFADINKALIVQGLEVWSEENKDEAWCGVKSHFKSRLGNESSGVLRNFLWCVLLLWMAGALGLEAPKRRRWIGRRESACAAAGAPGRASLISPSFGRTWMCKWRKVVWKSHLLFVIFSVISGSHPARRSCIDWPS